ncbi:MAG TPA: hypothetical protein VJK73_01405, partial [Candidatus Paceibacterota bacterium]
MARVRALAADAHELRQKAGIKVRQPLTQLSVPDALAPELAALLSEEVNVKRIVGAHASVELDIELTPELVLEGDEREMARAVAEARKDEGFVQGDQVRVAQDPGGAHAVELSSGTARFNLIRDSSRAEADAA